VALFVLEKIARKDSDANPLVSPSKIKPSDLRRQVFRIAAGSQLARSDVLLECSLALGLAPDEIEASLFADIGNERLLPALPTAFSAETLALNANLRLAQAILFRSKEIKIRVQDQSRAVVRFAKFRGLLCQVNLLSSADSRHGSSLLTVSGPYSLFRRTLIYGRRLGELLPILAWAQEFRLEAVCEIRGRPRTFELRSGAPIAPGKPPKKFDSRLEERFARDFAQFSRDWELIREPNAVPAGESLIFPDFLIRHRRNQAVATYLEIVGFWTPDYLTHKLSRLKAANIARMVLCVDESLGCAVDSLPVQIVVIPFRRKIDATEVLKRIELMLLSTQSASLFESADPGQLPA
jgi:uncharacterized protein